jgi:penicillin amidase
MKHRASLFLAALFFAASVFAQPAPQPDLVTRAKAVLAQTSGTLKLPGLQKPVTVLRDPWGIPHIYAETQDDLFFAQGFVAAQDRLFQMEIWRRAGEGRLAEIVGPEAVERDRFARLLRYRGDMEAEWTSYAPDAKSIIESFVRGVNAFIEQSRDRLPIEFQLAGFAPEPWTPEVCLLRIASWGVTGNVTSEVFRALLAREAGVELVDELLETDPPKKLEIPAGLDLAGIGQEIIAGALATGAPVSFKDAPKDGSNNWVVAGGFSATGKPLLANDPHRSIQLPSLRWMVHLVGPGWNVIGAGEPALPGVSAGHNDRVAFGFTIVGIDQQDLYVEETHPENPNQYRRGGSEGRWEEMRVERETIRVKGGEPVEVELKLTAHGPVLHEDRARRRAYALRWVGSEPGTAGYLGSLSLNRARNWDEFRKALERWKVPSENLLYADVDGNIGWQVAGLSPIRKGWDGLLPVPGDGRYEWQGFLPASELPAAFNPKSGFLATANHNILPAGYPHILGYEWAPPYRYQRLLMPLRAPGGKKFTVKDFEILQHDELSLPARRLIRVLAQAQAGVEKEAPLRPWVDRLLRWDAVLSKDSAEAAVYELWLAELRTAPFQPKLSEAQWKLVAPFISVDRAVDVIEAASPRWFGAGDEGRAARDTVLLRTLGEALKKAKERLGSDPAKWRWGTLHVTPFRHALSTDDARRVLFDLPSVERGGDGNTVNASGGPEFRAVHGASFREILDVADWDRSVATSVPGQSGQPGSPHYGDLLPLWAEGKYFPLLFSRERVEKEAKQKLVLEPVPGS